MLFKDAGNRFPQVVCRADVDASPLFPEVFEPHVIQKPYKTMQKSI